MKVANFKLCKQLYELSMLVTTPYTYYVTDDGRSIVSHEYPILGYGPGKPGVSGNAMSAYPAYDISYLLDKFPHILKHPIEKDEEYTFGLTIDYDTNKWVAGYERTMLPHAYDNNPEDACARLAIELFKQGILTKDAN